MADDLTSTIRKQRTFYLTELERMPYLPKRATVDEVKEYGMVNLVHTQRPGVKPWIKNGFYRMLRCSRLYVLEVGSNTTRGQDQAAWLYKPVIRVPSHLSA
jgi:hypothetical protein